MEPNLDLVLAEMAERLRSDVCGRGADHRAPYAALAWALEERGTASSIVHLAYIWLNPEGAELVAGRGADTATAKRVLVHSMGLRVGNLLVSFLHAADAPPQMLSEPLVIRVDGSFWGDSLPISLAGDNGCAAALWFLRDETCWSIEAEEMEAERIARRARLTSVTAATPISA